MRDGSFFLKTRTKADKVQIQTYTHTVSFSLPNIPSESVAISMKCTRVVNNVKSKAITAIFTYNLTLLSCTVTTQHPLRKSSYTKSDNIINFFITTLFIHCYHC